MEGHDTQGRSACSHLPCRSRHKAVGARVSDAATTGPGPGKPLGLAAGPDEEGPGSLSQTPLPIPGPTAQPKGRQWLHFLKNKSVSLKTSSEHEEYMKKKKKGILCSIKHHTFIENFLSSVPCPDPCAKAQGCREV